MQPRLETNEKNFIEGLIKNDVLKPIDWGIIAEAYGHLPDRCAIIDCSDCDQRERWRDYLRITARELNPDFKLHPFSLHGGGLLLPEQSPVNINGEDGRVLLRHVLESFKIKDDLGLVLVTSHVRCAKAKAAGISTPEKIALTLLGYRRVCLEVRNKQRSNIQIATLLMVNFGKWQKGCSSWGMKSYHLDLSSWCLWISGDGAQFIRENYSPQVDGKTLELSKSLF